MGIKSTNLSKIRRDKMLDTINEIKKNIGDERILNDLGLIENELTKKKYGLIWEEHEERVDKELGTQIPTFEEVKDKEIISNSNDKFNFLLEGDNLHSLYLLEKTHKGKIDVIYIDPPYNTGKKDFTYGDRIVDNTDEFRHSKWISFIYNRLIIAKELLTKNGLIFISIDDNELSNLRLICDEIFGEKNFIACFTWVRKKKGSFLSDSVRKMTEYILCYKSKEEVKIKLFGEDAYSDKMQPIVKRTNSLKTLFIQKNNIYTTLADGIYKKGFYGKKGTGIEFLNDFEIVNSVVSTDLSIRGHFIWQQDFLNNEINRGSRIYLSSKYGFNVLRHDQHQKIKTPSTLINSENNVGTNEDATLELQKLFQLEPNEVFSHSKPSSLIKYIIKMVTYNRKQAIILDFFAGSGTTGQAVLELNQEDKGNRQFILCTNNENNICEEITYQRIKIIITGTRKNSSKYSSGLQANLKYYKTSYVPRINTDKENLHSNLLINIKNLIQLENGIKIDDKIIKVYLDENDFDKFTSNPKELDECEKVYISSDILLTSEQELIVANNNIEVFIIPEYYFEDEIMEVT